MKSKGFKKKIVCLIAMLLLSTVITAQTSEPADVIFSFVPDTLTVQPGESFELQIAMTNTKRLAAYSIVISNHGGVYPDRSVPNTVIAGKDGFGEEREPSHFQAVMINPNIVVIGGFDVSGTAPGEHTDFLHVFFKASNTPGIREISITPDKCSDAIASELSCLGDTITIVVEEPEPAICSMLGDGNGDGQIDIVDALLIAQAYVGLSDVNININCLDVNCDGVVDIVDALKLAQAYVSSDSVIFVCL